MRPFKFASLCVALALLAGCASTPEGPAAPVATQSEASVTGGLDRYLDQRARVERVAFRLRQAAAPQCAERKEIKPDIGLIVWSLSNFPNQADRENLKSSFGLTNAVTVALAIDGAPAAKAGLKTGAIVTHVNDEPVGEGQGATERFLQKTSAAARKGSVRIRLAGGETLTATPQTVCEFPTLLVRAPEINAAADGRVLAITTGLFDLTRSDDELALILGHELAHNVLGHLERMAAASAKPDSLLDAFMRATIGTAVAKSVNQPFTVALEKEADRVGLYFMARAGYDVAAAEDFWHRLNETTNAKAVANTHPSGEERLRAIEVTVAEIKAKQKAKKPLDLPVKPQR